MRSIKLLLVLLLLAGLGSPASRSATALSPMWRGFALPSGSGDPLIDDPPTLQEKGFNTITVLPAVTPYTTITMDHGVARLFHQNVTNGVLAVDSHEVAHVVQVVIDSTDPHHPFQNLIYQNNLFETRRSNGFSDPMVLRTVNFPLPDDDQSTYDDSYGRILTVQTILDGDDTLHVFWVQTVPRQLPQPPPQVHIAWSNQPGYYGRIFHRTRTRLGTWSGIDLWSPENPPDIDPSVGAVSGVVYGLDYSLTSASLRRGPNGSIHLAAQVQYSFVYYVTPVIPPNGDLWPSNHTLNYVAYSTSSGDMRIVEGTRQKTRIYYQDYGQYSSLLPFYVVDSSVQVDGWGIDGSNTPVFVFTDILRQWLGIPRHDAPSTVVYYGDTSGKTPFGSLGVEILYAPGDDTASNPEAGVLYDRIQFLTDSQNHTTLYWQLNSSTYQLGQYGQNNPNLVASSDTLDPTHSGRFRKEANGATQVFSDPTLDSLGIQSMPYFYQDSRDQLHFLNGLNGQPQSLQIISKLKKPHSQDLEPTFVQSGIVAFSSGAYFGSTIFSKNGRLHFYQGDTYSRSRESVLGVRDSAAMIPVCPGLQANSLTGNLVGSVPLYSTQGTGPTQSVGLVYNSLEKGEESTGPGWRLSAEVYLIDHRQLLNEHRTGVFFYPDDIITIVQPDGRQIVFRYSPDYGYLIADPDQGVYARIERMTLDSLTTEYKLTAKNGDILWFNTDGRLRQIVDPVGNYTNFEFTDGHLTAIADQNGTRRSTILYQNVVPGYGDWVHQVVDPAGGRYDLDYVTSGTPTIARLSGITFSSGPSSPRYSFDYYGETNTYGEVPGMLSKFKTPRASAGGYSWDLSYYPNRQFGTVKDPSSPYLSEGAGDTDQPLSARAKLQLSFQGEGTILMDRRNSPWIYIGDSLRSLLTEFRDTGAMISPETIFPVKRTFDSDGRLMDVQDRWGFHTSYAYSTFAFPSYVHDNLSEIRRPDPNGGTQFLAAALSYTFDGFNQVASAYNFVSAPDGGQGRTTSYTYNSAGQVTQIQHPTALQPDGTDGSGTTKFEYNGYRNQLSRITNEEDHKTDFSDFDTVTAFPRSILREGGSHAVTRTFDVMGNQLSVTMPQGDTSNEVPGAATTILDSLYRVATQTDPSGQSTTYEYDVDSNVVRMTPPAGSATSTTYDVRGFVTGGTTPDGSWSQAVDASGNVRRSVDLRGFATNIFCDYTGRAIRIVSPGGSTLGGGMGGGGTDETTVMAYDLKDQDGRYMTSTVHGSPVNRTTRSNLDNWGRARQVIAPDGKTKTETFYDELNRVMASQQIFNGTVQTCTVTYRDGRDRVTRVSTRDTDFRSPGGGQQSNTYTIYNPTGTVRTTVDALGDPTAPGQAHKMTYLHDVRERVEFVVDGKGVTVAQYIYGDDDQVREVKVPNPATKKSDLTTSSTHSFSKRKEMLSSRDVFGNGNTYSYGPLTGQISTVTDGEGQVTRTTYDPTTQRLDTRIEAAGTPAESQTRHIWANGLLSETRVWNPEGGGYTAAHRRFYDQAGRLERTESPAVGQGKQIAAERYFYNGFGEMNLLVAGTKTVEHQFNSLGQAVQSNWNGAYSTQVQRTYNGAGHLESITDGTLTKTMFYNTWKGTLNTESIAVAGQPWKAQMHSFDNAGNYTDFTDGEGAHHQWPVDENNRQTEIRYKDQTSRSISYTPGGLVDREILRNAAGAEIATTTHQYNAAGDRVSSQTVQGGTGAVLHHYEWDYDRRHQISAVHLKHLGVDVTLGLDARGRPATESTPGNNGGNVAPPFTNNFGGDITGNIADDSNIAQSSPNVRIAVAPRSASYTFSASGNRTGSVIDGITSNYVYNAANQLVSESSPAKSVDHEYDEWGNEVKRTTALSATPQNPNPGTQVETYTYNYQNLMSGYANSASGANWQYDFYPTGERYGKTNLNSGTSELYVPRFDDVATEYSQQGTGAPILKNSYVQSIGIDSKTIKESADGTRSHYLTDQVGTLSTVLSDAGEAVATTFKDAWGVTLCGTTGERYSGVAQRELDSESGLIYMRHRMYDPALGRFTQTDPRRANRPLQHYVYANNSPSTCTDPKGDQYWNHVIGALGEKAAQRAFAALGWQFVGKVASTTSAGFDLVFFEKTAEGAALRVIENKAYGAARSLADKSLTAVGENFSKNMAATLEKVAASKLSDAVKAQILQSVEKGTAKTIITNFFGNALKLSGQKLAAATAQRVTIMAAEDVVEQAVARVGPGIALRIFSGAKLFLGAAATVGGAVLGVLAMDSPAEAAEIDPYYDMYQALNFMIHQGWTNLKKTDNRYTGQDTSDIEIETWRLTEPEFAHLIEVYKSMMILDAEEKEQLVNDLREERRRLTDSEK